MRAILPLYLTTAMHFAKEDAGQLYSWFKAACYALPLLGGFLADRYFGKYRTIVAFSIPYVLGHFVLGLENTAAVIIALILLAGGSGVIKPNISTLMGETYDQQRPGQTQLRSAAFMWFYFAINVGALISTLALPALRDKYGYAVAFQFPAWLMVLSLGVFAAGKRFYAVESLEQPTLTHEQQAERWTAIGKLFGVFGMITLFWIPYEHMDSVWVFFTRDYVELPTISYLDFNREWQSYQMPPDQLQFINPLCVMIFAPLFASLFPKIDPTGRLFTDRFKILLGLGIGTLASAVMTIAGFLATADTKISVMWLVVSYVLLTIGEVLVYGTGLDLAFSAAPKDMKGFVTGCFLLTMTAANFFNGFWVRYYDGGMPSESPGGSSFSPPVFFALSGLFAVLATALMAFVNLEEKQPKPATS